MTIHVYCVFVIHIRSLINNEKVIVDHYKCIVLNLFTCILYGRQVFQSTLLDKPMYQCILYLT